MKNTIIVALLGIVSALVGAGPGKKSGQSPGSAVPKTAGPPSPVGEVPCTTTGTFGGFPISERVIAAVRKRFSSRPRWEVQSMVEEALEKAREQLRIILLFLSDIGCPTPPSQFHEDSFVRRLALYNCIDLGEKYLKWKFAHIACVALGQFEFPEVPDFVHSTDRATVLLGGSVHRWMRRMMHHCDYDLGWSISQLKKGMPIMSESALAKAVHDTVTALSSRDAVVLPPDSWFTPEEEPFFDENWDLTVNSPRMTTHDIRTLDFQCRRTTRELFRRGWYKEQPVYIPSISGHFDVARKKSGALGALVRDRVNTDHEVVFLGTYLPPHCHRTPRIEVDVKSLFPVCCACHSDYDSFCLNCGWHPDDYIVRLDVISETGNALADSFQYDERHLPSLYNLVVPVGLKEPFKIRVITGGPEGRYYRCKYIQKAVHSHLRRVPNAALIGETISADRLNQILWTPNRGEFYVSGDYSSATDNLDPRLSRAVAEEISRMAGWHQDWEDEFVEALVDHRIYAGDPRHKVNCHDYASMLRDSVQQTWGQLMGSPVSFPVLCLVNLALSRFALEVRYGRRISIRDSGILINGDDIGFVTDTDGYRIWKGITAAGGLSPSLGKNFCSRDFIVLNSTFFDVRTDHGVRSLHYRPYINYGLIECRNENGTPIEDPRNHLHPSDDPRTPGVGALAHDLIKGHPEELQLVLLKRFLKNWKPFLDKFCPRGMSYYLPTHLGGLGLPIIGDFHSPTHDSRFSRAQRMLAKFLDKDPASASELVSMSQIGRSDSLSLWNKISGKVSKHMSPIGFQWTRKDGPAADSGLTAPLLASAFAGLSDEDIPELEDGTNEDKYRQWRKSYETLFDIAEKSTYKPMTDEQIVASRPWVKKYDDYVVIDTSPRVDLRNAPNQILTFRYQTPSIRLISCADDMNVWVPSCYKGTREVLA